MASNFSTGICEARRQNSERKVLSLAYQFNGTVKGIFQIGKYSKIVFQIYLSSQDAIRWCAPPKLVDREDNRYSTQKRDVT